jgi:hypothetical protein
MALPPTVTSMPPESRPTAGVTVTPLGAAGVVPSVVLGEYPGLASLDDAVAREPVWIVVAVIPVAVTTPTRVMADNDVPLVNGVLLFVQVIF